MTAAAATLVETEDLFSDAGKLSPFDLIASLVSEYNTLHAKIVEIADYVGRDPIHGGALQYFLDGNRDKEDRIPSAMYLFKREGAIACLRSHFWSKAISQTDVFDLMPQKRRDEWHETIDKRTCPDFTEQIVRDTFANLLASRAKFLAERVDGIFRALSGEHVTNRPEGFGKRMIIANMLYMGDVSHQTAGYLNDLRAVIAKFMGRDSPKHHASNGLVRMLKNSWGEWVPVDGGVLRVRLYKKGTAHIEVHPDMAWRLNNVLAMLYPKAIPPQFRERPKTRPHDVPLIQRPLPFSVVELLGQIDHRVFVRADSEVDGETVRCANPEMVLLKNACRFEHSVTGDKGNRQSLQEAEAILESLGGVKMNYYWQFDYFPKPAIDHVVVYGCVPDDKAHQFYPTPLPVAQTAVALAQIGPHDTCLEPQAGHGGLADLMPKERTLCVEISELRAKVLRAKGHKVECADFLAWAQKIRLTGRTFDRIVMNPPFDNQRWRAHLEAAADLLSPKGRLVSVLPKGASTKENLLPGFGCTFPESYAHAFPGVSQETVLLVAERHAVTRVETPVSPARNIRERKQQEWQFTS